MKLPLTEEVEISPIGENSLVADTLHVFPCPEGEHVHFVMTDEDGNALCEMLFQADQAYSIAKRIESAADESIGIE